MKTRALEVREILRIALQMADALDVAHSKGITIETSNQGTS